MLPLTAVDLSKFSRTAEYPSAMQKVIGDQTKIAALISILRCHLEIAQRHCGQVEQVILNLEVIKKEKGAL
jgi:hypothetical protein